MREEFLPQSSKNFLSKKESVEERTDFERQYENRQTMDFEIRRTSRRLEYVEATPKEIKGKDVYLAVGTPWNWNLSKELVFSLFSAGHKVFVVNHPIYSGIKSAGKYDPIDDRKKAVETFFEKKAIQACVVVAHSVGLIDIIEKGPKGIEKIVAINPAGLSENGFVNHNFNVIKSIKKVIESQEGKEKEYFQEILKEFLAQNPLKSFKDVGYASKADLREKMQTFFAKVPVAVFRNDDDTLTPIDQAFEKNAQILTGGGNHLGPFIYQEQREKILEEIEKN